MAGPLAICQGKNQVPFHRKQVVTKSTRVIFVLLAIACYIMVQQIEKGYDEVENNQSLTHIKIFHAAEGILLCKN